MATIDNKKMIDDMIAANGYYMDDPQVYMIVEYTNAYGNITWGVTWHHDMTRERYLDETEFVRNPKIIWQAQS